MSFFAGVERGVDKVSSLFTFFVLLLLTALVFGSFSGGFKLHQVSQNWGEKQKYQVISYAKRKAGLRWGSYSLPTRFPNAKPHQLDAWLQRAWVNQYAKPMREVSLWSAAGAGLGSLLFVIYSMLFRSKKDDHRRGSQVVSPATLASLVHKQSRDKPNYKIANVPLPFMAEHQHMMMLGGPGSGKSQAIDALLKQARRMGDKVLCFDPGGIFLSHHFKAGDKILNPFDSRSVAWSPLIEINSSADADSMAKSVMQSSGQSGGGGDNQYFLDGARQIFAETFGIIKQGLIDNDYLKWLTRTPLDQLHQVLQHTPANIYLDPKAKGTGGGGVLSTLISKLNSWKYLEGVAGEDFSIKQWVRDDSDKSWLWLNAVDREMASMESLISTWIDTAALETMSRQPFVEQTRIWIVIDELGSLQKLPALLQLLAKGRKYWAIVVLSTQTPSQVESIYKKEGKRAIAGTIGTWLLYRLPEPEDAESASKMIGDVELMRTNENHSTGKGGKGHSTSSQVVKERAILSSELQNLPDLTGYLLLPGDYPTAKVRTKYVEHPLLTDCIKKRNMDFNNQQKRSKLGIDLGEF